MMLTYRKLIENQRMGISDFVYIGTIFKWRYKRVFLLLIIFSY